MAHKKHVHKKGKKHGRHYYKNIRDKNSKVKSIYPGKVTERGKRPLEVTIVFLVMLLIIISTLFFLQNRTLILSRIAVEEDVAAFEVDQILIKVLVKADEYIEKELRVMNVGGEEEIIEVNVFGLSDIVDVLDSRFTIKPGQTKIVRLNFSSFNKKEKIEQTPGVYIGKILAKTDSYEREVPVIVEIESKNVLFDMNLKPLAKDKGVLQGSSTTFEIIIFNLQSIEAFNIGMEFFIKDINGNTIISEKESVVVKTQTSFFKTFKIPKNLKTGNYVFAAQASLGNSIGTASYLFDVKEFVEEEKAFKFVGFCKNDPWCWTLSIVVLLLVLLLIVTLGAYAYFFIGTLIYEKFSEEKKKGIEEKIKKEELEEKKEKKVEGRKSVEKCRKLIDKGYKTLNKNNLKKSKKIYTKLLGKYMELPNERKAEIFKEINSFYKSFLLKWRQLKQETEKEKEEEEYLKREKEIGREKERKKKAKELEKRRIEEEERRHEEEGQKREEEERKKRELEVEKRGELEKEREEERRKDQEEREGKKERKPTIKEFLSIFKKKEKVEETPKHIKEEEELENLEEQITRLGATFEQKKEEKKLGFFGRILKRKKIKIEKQKEETKEKAFIKPIEGEEERQDEVKEKKSLFSKLFMKKETEDLKKQKEEVRKKREGKSGKFIKCHKLLLNVNEALRNGYDDKAKKLFFKAREVYLELEYWEKKEIYHELMVLYNKLNL